MEIVRTYKFRLMPTPEQAERLNSWCAAIRKVYNAALEQRLMYSRINPTRKRGGTALRDHSKERAYIQRRGGQIDTRRADLLQNSTIQKRISDGKIDPMTLGGVVGAVGPDPFDRDVRFSAIGQKYDAAPPLWLRRCEGHTADTFTDSHPANGGGASMAATSAGGVQAAALVQG